MIHRQESPAHGPAWEERGAAKASEFLTFRVGKEHYGVEILKVQEIRRWEPTTPIADSPDFVKGVINLRGTIVPIIDMRMKLNSGDAAYGELTAVIVLNVAGRVVGMVVDAVSEVVVLGANEIRPLPEVSLFRAHCILGIGVREQLMLILLDIEKLLAGPEMALVEGVVH